MPTFKILLLLLCVFLLSCIKEEHERSFCYWKTTLEMDNEEDSLFNQLNINHLYLRFFDIDYNYYSQKALPVASINGWRFPNDSNVKHITPCIFITNKVIENLNETELDSLAANIHKRIQSIISQRNESYAIEAANHYLNEKRLIITQDRVDSLAALEKKKGLDKIQEILIDCDWTEKTKDKYFHLLTEIKKRYKGFEIATTIRLWQYKYPQKAGIPPVDRGLLMCYNLGNHTDYAVKNSIVSIAELEKYLIQSNYDLDLDIALPLFDCTILFSKEQYQGIISLDKAGISVSDTSIFASLGENKYAFKKDIEMENRYIRMGDELRVEKIAIQELQEIAKLLKSKIPISQDTKITFFSWNKNYIANYGTENIEKIYEIWNY